VLLLFLTTTMMTMMTDKTVLSRVLKLFFAAVCESTVYLIQAIEGIVKMLGLLSRSSLSKKRCAKYGHLQKQKL
jgi:hypothetical protein